MQIEISMRCTKTRTGLLLLVTLCMLRFGHAQQHDIPRIRSDRFLLTQQRLQISLQQVRTRTDYVIGIKIDKDLQYAGFIEIGDFVTSDSASSGGREFESLTALDLEKLKFSNNAVTVTRLGGCKGALSVLLTVPPGTKVVISVNGRTHFAGIPVKGAILHRGKVVSTTFSGQQQLFSRLLFPEIDESSPKIKKTKSDYLVNQDGLNEHLITFNKPSNHPESIGESVEIVTISIRIDRTGSVTVAKPSSGKEPFVSEAVKAIGGAHFKPFIVSGLPVEASGDVTIIFSKNGRVSSTLKQ